ncbi:hypothetical protein EDC04DRAFT_2605923 [Pisolithus marmoratus]|nr:hypothetical protein EDC04DRAFT_2605923 [Pisolithus marmoratus]
MSQSTIPVFGHDYAEVGVPIMWNNKMSAIQGLLNAVPLEGDDLMDLYRWLDRYDQLHYKAESICNYAQGMHVAIPELPEVIKVLMAAADLVITKLQLLHHEHKPWMTVPRIFMVPPSAWVPSNVEGYGDRPKWAQKQAERAAASSGKGKQKMTQDDDDDNGADDHKDNIQGSSDDGNDRVSEHLKGPSPAPSPLVPSPELPIASQSLLFLGSMTPSSVWYPNCTLTPANFSPLAGVDKLQELFEGGFSAMATGLLQDEEMLVTPEEAPVTKEESPIETIPQETPEGASPPRNASSLPVRMTLWLHALDEWIECLEEIIEMNKVEVAEMHKDLARFMA